MTTFSLASSFFFPFFFLNPRETHRSVFKKKLLLLATVNTPYIYIYIGRFGRFRFRGFNSVGFTTPASDCLSPSASQPWLSRSVLPAVRLRRRRSVLSTPILVCTVLLLCYIFLLCALCVLYFFFPLGTMCIGLEPTVNF